MNIIEAVKSGRRFCRPHDLYYNQAELEINGYFFTRKDLLAEDYELEPATENDIALNKIITNLREEVYRLMAELSKYRNK